MKGDFRGFVNIYFFEDTFAVNSRRNAPCHKNKKMSSRSSTPSLPSTPTMYPSSHPASPVLSPSDAALRRQQKQNARPRTRKPSKKGFLHLLEAGWFEATVERKVFVNVKGS